MEASVGVTGERVRNHAACEVISKDEEAEVVTYEVLGEYTVS